MAQPNVSFENKYQQVQYNKIVYEIIGLEDKGQLAISALGDGDIDAEDARRFYDNLGDILDQACKEFKLSTEQRQILFSRAEQQYRIGKDVTQGAAQTRYQLIKDIQSEQPYYLYKNGTFCELN